MGKSSSGWPATVAKSRSLAISIPAAAAIVAIATTVSWVGLDHHLPDVVMVYLLGVVVASTRFGLVAAIVAATLGVAAFDFFFTTPYFSLAVDDRRFVSTFGIMFLVALAISVLMERIRRIAADAIGRERRAARLYAMTRELSTAPTVSQIASVAHRHLGDIVGADVSVLLAGPERVLRAVGLAGSPREPDARILARAQAIFAGESDDSTGSEAPTGAERIVLLRGATGVLGVLIAHTASPSVVDAADRGVLETMVREVALALERARVADDELRSQLEGHKERLRTALLGSVSHDMRTPIAVLKGIATALLEGRDDLPAERRHQYLESLSDEMSRLNLLVDNLVNATSLEVGTPPVKREWQPLEETIGVALSRLEKQLGGRPIEIAIPGEASMVAFDARLLEQVFVNLVENAARYTPPGSRIEIRADVVAGGVEIQVADRGPGVPAGREEQIFGKFERAIRAPSGMGLGLAICRGVLTVHGGRIWCENRAGGGSAFHFILPRPDEPPRSNLPTETFADR
jgi:two-component system, OmpR family, sensor histidine kinase KdpD